MSSESERVDWLHEHLNYELLTMRHTYKQLQALPKTAKDQLVWNANFAAFSLYARNLYRFLTNDPETRSFKASDYERPKADGQPVRGIMSNLNEQVFHPGKQRVNADKVGLKKVKALYEWVEASLKHFSATSKSDTNRRGRKTSRSRHDLTYSHSLLPGSNKIRLGTAPG